MQNETPATMSADKRIMEAEVAMGMKAEPPERDRCPHCLTKVRDFPYVDGIVNRQMAWLECPTCGTIFTPQSIREQKLAQAKEAQGHILKASPKIVVPGRDM